MTFISTINLNFEQKRHSKQSKSDHVGTILELGSNLTVRRDIQRVVRKEVSEIEPVHSTTLVERNSNVCIFINV